ncbi:MAG TPA: glycosyltransferase [Candidatus Tectomicrobia bacterium]|nr:glycosyltransferase [Candidatus Tectomicrobia bacterium]
MTAHPSRLHIAILSCNYGGGHQRVAEVIADELRQRSPGCRVEIHDYIETCIGHWSNIAFSSLYFGSVRWTPCLYRWFYHATGSISPASPVQRCINSLGKRRLAALLRMQRPDIVVCTYCLPAGVMSELKRRGRTDVPCVTVITDHAIHSQWIHPGVDLYVVSSDHIRDGMAARGIAPDRVLSTGIPVSPALGTPRDRQALRRQYGLDPALPTILVLVGAYNLMRGALDVYRSIVELPRPAQFLVVCGKDERLRQAIEHLTRRLRVPVRVFGYVREIPELMAMSDLAISKAGGVTTSEALAAELPMVIVNPIPGQEEENSSFLQAVEAAIVAPRPADLRNLIADLLDDPRRLARLRAGARRVKRPDAAARAAAAILSLTPGYALAAGEA